MESFGSALSVLFQEKRVLYRELIDLLTIEREALIAGQTDRLWDTAAKKQQAASKIEALRERILDVLTENGIDHEMTVESFRPSGVLALVSLEVRKPLIRLQSDLALMKEEIHARTRENRGYVGNYLATLDELIGLFMREKNGGAYYDRHRHVETIRTRTRLHREV